MLAGSVFLKFGQTVSYAFNGSRRRDQFLRANDLIQWQAINDAFRSGFTCFDLGEVPKGHRKLAQFKSKWGAEPVQLYRYYYPSSPELEARDGALCGDLPWLAEALWKKLPIKATAWLGDRLYGYL